MIRRERRVAESDKAHGEALLKDAVREAAGLYDTLRRGGVDRESALTIAGMRWKCRTGGRPLTEAIFEAIERKAVRLAHRAH